MARPHDLPLDPPRVLGTARFRAIIGMSLLIMTGFGLIVPALPQLVEDLGRGESGIGIVVFAFALTRLVGDIFVGGLIDRFGERAVTAAGAIVVGVSSIAAGVADTFMQLVVLRGLGGFGSSFFLGGLMAYLLSATPAAERGRAMSIFQGSFGIGFVLGPVAGGALLAISSARVPLFAYGATLLLAVPLILHALRATHTPGALVDAPQLPEESPPPRTPALAQLRPLLARPAYVAALATSALMFFLTTGQMTILADFWTDILGATPATSGVPFTVAGAFGILVIWHAGSITDARGRKAALVPSLLVTVVVTAALGFTTSIAVVLLLLAAGGAMGGYMRPGPSAMVADVSSEATRAVAVAGYRFAGDLGAVAGFVVGPIAEYMSFQAAWIAMAVVAAVVLVVVARADETLPSAA